MPKVTAHGPGTFCWIELGTSDAGGAKAFYTGLFGWDVSETPMGENETYYIFKKDGADTAAMYQMGAQMQGIPPNWLSYVAVSDADGSVDQAKRLGGNVMNGPFDVMDFGRMAVIADPQGAAFAVWQARTNIGVGVRDEPDTLCWNELQTRDVQKAKHFYADLFGWRAKESPEYIEVSAGEQPIGGIMQSQAPPHVPSYWLAYFAVDDCDGTAEKARSLGATIRLDPMDVPNVGRFSVIVDPQGATFAVIQLNF
jgi:predicted enzyme related to lactoylglutathione lyase